MIEDLDIIARYAKHKNFDIRPRTIFVEGTTDVRLFELAAAFEKKETGVDLLGDHLAIIAAGEGEDGGVRGVCRELVCFKNIAGSFLLSNGRPKYKFIGLFDNDQAGRQAISDVRKTDSSIVEFKDVFRLMPVMPSTTNRDPEGLKNCFEDSNRIYKGLDWELEDLLPQALTNSFFTDFPTAISHSKRIEDKVHNDLTRDGKARLHHFISQNAIRSDLEGVTNVLKVFWLYLGIRTTERK